MIMRQQKSQAAGGGGTMGKNYLKLMGTISSTTEMSKWVKNRLVF